MKKEIYSYVETLPLLPYEKEEVLKAVERSLAFEWVKARQEIKWLVEDRIKEKKERKLSALLSDDKVNQLVPISEDLLYYIEKLWGYGYSSSAISKGLKYSVSAPIISQKMDPVSVRKRGQVIELMNDFISEFNVNSWRLPTSTTYKQGPKITEEEKQKFKELKQKGYSTEQIAYYTGRSANAIRRWLK